MAESSGPQPNARDPAPKTEIHNHITRQSTTLDLAPLLAAFDSFLLSTRQCVYPQLIVTCRGQKRAFSRVALKDMGHKRAMELFVTRFARAEDYAEMPPGTGWFATGRRRKDPGVECLATFCRTEPDSAGDAPVPLDASGWVDTIGNVRALDVVLTQRAV
ncbi:hypothetical protein B0H15DRAFT_143361 [Mycena belliarum]|uniref:Uncharacterized protein n=1 Tax=Mycena belliarum TaxID=1033014 RepID=A0AAD6U795_9AGAR|nr:hypothetical protein B0H15DRAFT_143361 [Mycena belliae]